MDREDLVALAQVGRPHGVAGDLRVRAFNPASDLWLDLEDVLLRGPDGATRPARIESARNHGDSILIRFDGIADRTAAEGLRGFEICVRRSELPPAGEGEVYHVDVVGLEAVSTDGRPLGSVREVLSYPASDCLVVEGEGATYEVPWLEPYVVEIDLPSRRIVIAHLEDLEPVPRRG